MTTTPNIRLPTLINAQPDTIFPMTHPVAKAARIAVREVARFLEDDDTLEKVILVAFQPAASRAYWDAVAAWEAGKLV